MNLSETNIIVNSLLDTWRKSGKTDMTSNISGIIAELQHKNSAIPVIYVGTATCGRIAGALKTKEAISDYFKERNIKVLIVEVGCIGLCSEEPLVDIQIPGKQRVSFRKITPGMVKSLLDDVLHKKIPPYQVLGQYAEDKLEAWKEVRRISGLPFFASQKRLVLKDSGLIDPASIEEYIAYGGYISFLATIGNHTREEVCSIVEESGLRGRAGGGFPVGQKWRSSLQCPGDIKYVICNAQESDPGAFLDRNIIESIPYQLIEGLSIAAYASGASKAFIYIRNEYKHAIELLKTCIQQSKKYGLTGYNIFGSGFNLELELRLGPGAFVCGEETALIASIEGRRGMPQVKPPYPSEKGLFHKPTVINNVESLCNIPIIISHGPEKFRLIGTEKSKGTKIFSVSGKSKHSGMIEVPMGTSLRDLVFNMAGGIKNDKLFKAIQLGGPNGWCIPEENLDAHIDYEELISLGAGMGSGGLVVFDENTCLVDMARYYMDFMQKQSCGKCIPCREGSKRTLEILDGICKRPDGKNGHSTLERFKGVMQLESIANVMQETSLCGLGVNASNPVLSSLHWFREEFEEHIFDRYCRSGTCGELRSYQIEVEKCPGCGQCVKCCLEKAIIGTELHPYFIIEEKCTGCGFCYDACKFAAIKLK